jgi:hypothetical protein
MAKQKTFNLNLASQEVSTEKITVYVDADGKPCSKDDAKREESGDVTLLKTIPDVDKFVSLFGSLESALKFVVSQVNTKMKAEKKLSILAHMAGPEKIIADTRDKLLKAGTPEAVVDGIIATMRATLIA